MKVTLALICDAANVTEDGKLNVVGQFDHVMVDAYPLRMRPKCIALRMSGSSDEFQNEQPFAVRAYNEAGKEIGEILGLVEPRLQPRGAALIQAVAILPLFDPHIPEPGSYRIDILLCEEVVASIDPARAPERCVEGLP